MEKYICIHGHFYQPPRENPWLESVELEDSAAPFHDWNERVTAECYGRNASSRMLDGEGRIERIVNNYSKISFNFGPTLLAWMQAKAPSVHDAIVEADRQSQQNYSGHGSALAQVYNHMILPLANERDQYTQVLWGIRDFEFRFGRRPEGMWLAETAADTPTLETLAQLGIQFTILAPGQASRFRELGKRNWREVNGATIDPTRPYLCRLPSGKTITLFFYDGPVSQAVAFEKLLNRGELFAERLATAFSDARNRDQLVHIATDGESYGHHHFRGEMALAYALRYIERNHLAKLTNYGEFLEKHPPGAEAQIHEQSSWSCCHGVGRWRSPCGCNSGGRPEWSQEWRAPLRQALDWLRDEIAPLFEQTAREYLPEPWAARDDYISVILDRSDENLARFFSQHSARELTEPDQIKVLQLMELQRHAMLMYTSCGWFFDEVSGIESVQVIRYAARAIQLARDLSDRDLEPGFLERLEAAKSNLPEHRDGRVIYNQFVKPSMIDWDRVVAHYAVSSVFTHYEQRSRIYLYDFDEQQRQTFSAGRAKLVVGTVKVQFEITRESEVRSYAVLYLGEHNLTGGVRRFPDAASYDAILAELQAAFESADFPQTIRLIDRHFGESNYSLKSLFKDEQRRVLQGILSSTHEDLENRYRLIAERYTPLMTFLRDLGAPLPVALQTAVDFILHVDICHELEAENTDLERLKTLLAEAQSRTLKTYEADIAYVIIGKLERLLERLMAEPEDLAWLQHVEGLARQVRALPMDLNFWRVRNRYWEMLQKVFPGVRERAAQGEAAAQAWLESFLSLGDQLGFAVKKLQP